MRDAHSGQRKEVRALHQRGVTGLLESKTLRRPGGAGCKIQRLRGFGGETAPRTRGRNRTENPAACRLPMSEKYRLRLVWLLL